MSLLRKFLTLTFIVGSLLVLSQEAYASFTFTVSPRRGGQGIHFERSTPGNLLRNEEVTFTVTSTEAVQYRILQTMYQPLTNELGNTIPQGAFIFFSPSQPLGTLYNRMETPIVMGQNQIYTSNSAGDTDTFVLVYNVRVPEDQPGGVYHTNISYTAEPITPKAGVSSVQVNLDVRVEIRPTFHITVQNARGGRSLDLGRITKNSPSAKGTLKIEIESNIGGVYRIVQQLTSSLSSQEGVDLDESALTLAASGGQNGSLGAASSISPVSQIIYTSNPSGQGDVIELEYLLSPPAEQRAGLYSGGISFKVDSNSPLVSSEVINAPITLEIESIFDLEVQIEQGFGTLDFGTFRSGEEQSQRSVELSVNSNIGRPYQISQITKEMANAEGQILQKERFLYFADAAKTGLVSEGAPTIAPIGESVVFTSDNKGTSETIHLHYQLSIPSEAKKGSYASNIKYSVTTL